MNGLPKIQVGTPGAMDIAAVRHLAQSNPEAFLAKARRLINDGKFSLERINDWRALYYSLADVNVRVEVQDGLATRSVLSSAFPTLCGDLVAKAVQSRYEAYPSVAQDLVEEFDDPNKITYLARILTLDKDQESVREGDDFPEIGATEEVVTIGSRLNGRRLSISKGAIDRNEVGGIVRQINKLPEIAAEHIEELTISKLADENSDVYAPNGSPEALYSTTARARTGTGGNLKESNALAAISDFENARLLLAAMKNDRGKRLPIPWSEVVIFVPTTIVDTAFMLLNSELLPGGSNNDINQWGPKGMWRPKIVSTAKLDDISTSTWYMGVFKRQFKRKWSLRLENVTLGETTESYLKSRVAFQARLAWDVMVGADDYVWVVKNTA